VRELPPAAGRPDPGGATGAGRPAAGAVIVVAVMAVVAAVVAGAAGLFDGLRLLPATLAATVEALAVAALVGSWCSRRPGWLTRRLPAAVLTAVALTAATAATLRLTGIVTDAYPLSFALWVGLALCALVGLPLVAARSGWLRRLVALAAVALTVSGAFLLINDEYGAWPTLGDLLGHTYRPGGSAVRLPARAEPAHGMLVVLDPPATLSHFSHRPGTAYLPPAYFGPERSTLPVVMLLAGVPGTPTQWVTSGRAVATTEAYASAHHGRAPVLLFVDDNGSATGDTECVDGPQGNAETYLADDVPVYVRRTLGLTARPDRWAIVGFSEGGTCAAELALSHPATFGRFVDLAGDAAPTLGNRTHTLYRLFGGSAARERAHNVVHLLRTNKYPGMVAWFGAGVNDQRKLPVERALAAAAVQSGLQVHDFTGIAGHNWQFARAGYAEVLPDLCAELGLADSSHIGS
jgi:S-formylglutathione hydrolase FrmB